MGDLFLPTTLTVKFSTTTNIKLNHPFRLITISTNKIHTMMGIDDKNTDNNLRPSRSTSYGTSGASSGVIGGGGLFSSIRSSNTTPYVNSTSSVFSNMTPYVDNSNKNSISKNNQMNQSEDKQDKKNDGNDKVEEEKEVGMVEKMTKAVGEGKSTMVVKITKAVEEGKSTIMQTNKEI